MHCRLELETTKGKVFTGPFVFELPDGIKKLSRMGWLTKTKGERKRGVLRLVEMEGKWPREVLWHPKFDDEDGGKHDRRVRQVEMAWKRLEFFEEKGEEERND